MRLYCLIQNPYLPLSRVGLILLLLTLSLGTVSRGDPPPAQAPFDAQALEAYHSFWNVFEKRQKAVIMEAQKKYEKSWQELADQHLKQTQNLEAKTLEQWLAAAAAYRQELHARESSPQRPYLLLNLAQVVFLIGELYEKNQSQQEEPNAYKQEAASLLEEIKQRYPQFEKKDFTLFLLAHVYNALQKEEQALAIWKSLARLQQPSHYSSYAFTAIGDHHFYHEDPNQAVTSYEQALVILELLGPPAKDDEKLMLEYRLAWAAYRSGQLAKVIATFQKILAPNRFLSNHGQHLRLSSDAEALLGDALYELSEGENIHSYFRPNRFGDMAAAIGLHTLRRFAQAGQSGKVLSLGELLSQDFPLSQAFPETIMLTAAAYQQQMQSRKALGLLEKLGLLLPANSLWRAQHQKDPATIAKMETQATQASEMVANWHFQAGRQSGLSQHFVTAAAYYKFLLAHIPASELAHQWRMQLAHAYYYGGFYEDAAKQWSQLLQLSQLDPRTQAQAAYQLALSYEHMWRKSFRQELEGKIGVGEGEKSQLLLQRLETAVDHYHQQFPDTAEALELFLIAASANRDQAAYERAIIYWQKLLAAKASPAQRTIAIRGIVFAHLQHKSKGEAIVVIKRFLRLENWQKLAAGLRRELVGVLSQAGLDEAQFLQDKGKLVEAGELLTKLAEEFPELPHRPRIARDGAYYFALGGQWQQAQKAAETFLASGMKELRGDILYLLARSCEYQLRFPLALDYYLQLAHDYPQHRKSKKSLLQAEKLALAENQASRAGAALAKLAALESQKAKKSEYLQRAARHYLEGQEARLAMRFCKERLKLESNTFASLETQILLAQAYRANGDELQALQLLNGLIEQANVAKDKLGTAAWSQLVSQAHLLLADEWLKAFQELELGNKRHARALYQQKSAHFSKLKSHLLQVIAAQHQDYSPAARFKLADAAERFADELAALYPLSSLNSGRAQAHDEEIRALKGLAAKLFGQNAILAHQKLGSLAPNPWAQKSLWRIPQQPKMDEASLPQNMALPHAVPFDLPYQWSF